MGVVHTSKLRIEKHDGPHRTARLEGFAEPIPFGIHGGIRHFYRAVKLKRAGLVPCEDRRGVWRL